MEMPKKVASRLQKVQKKQPTAFAGDEQLLSACAVVSVSQAQPAPIAVMFGVVGVLVASFFDNTKVKARTHEVQLATGALDTPFNELPKSKNGYTFVLTNKRVVVFDGAVKKYLTECDVTTAQIGVVRHATGRVSIALRDGTEVVAVTAQRTQEEMVEHFIAHYPNQRIGSAPPASASTMDHYVSIPSTEPLVNPYAHPATVAPTQPIPAAAPTQPPLPAPPVPAAAGQPIEF